MTYDHELLLIQQINKNLSLSTNVNNIYFQTQITLADAGLAVKLSCKGKNGQVELGLFTLRRYSKNELITTYGGSVVDPSVLTEKTKTHARGVPGDSNYAYSAYEWSRCFRQLALQNIDIDDELSRPISERSIIQPVDGENISADLVKKTGVGYMANTKAKLADQNIKKKEITMPQTARRKRLHCGIPIIAYVAKENLPAHTELFCKYKNDGGQWARSFEY